MTYDHVLMIRYTFIVIKAYPWLNYVIMVKNEGWLNNIPV